MLSNTVILTNDQIKALPTTPFDVVPAPGADKTLVFFGALFRRSDTGFAYTNVNADAYGGIGYGVDNVYVSAIVANDSGALEFSLTDLLNSSLMETLWPLDARTPSWYNKMNNQGADEYSVNQPLVFWCSNSDGDFTGGDPSNTLTITIFYAVVDL